MISEAYTQSKAIDMIQSNITELSLHCLKYWLLPNMRSRKHWLVDEILPRIIKFRDYSVVKTKKGTIAYDVYKKELSKFVNYDRVKDYIRTISLKYRLDFKSIDIEYYRNELEEFYDELWKELSEGRLDIDWFLNKFEYEG